MKKITLFVLIFAVCCACVFAGSFATAFAAQSDDVKIELRESVSSEELTVTARLTENKGFVSGIFRIDYDNAGLTLESVAYAETCKDLDPFDNLEKVKAGEAEHLFVFYAGEGNYSTETGDLFTMTFRVKDGVLNGKHKVSLYITELFKTSSPDEQFDGQDETLGTATTGGVLAAETEYFIENGVPAPADPEANYTLVIVLATVGGLLVVAGIVVLAYFGYRKKRKAISDGSDGSETKKDQQE